MSNPTSKQQLRLQVANQCRAVSELASALAEVHRQVAIIYEHGSSDATLDMVGRRTAGVMETLGNWLNNMDAADEPADWIADTFAEAQRLYPQQSETFGDWRAIGDVPAPRDTPAIFWIVSKDPDECYLDTDGRPIHNSAPPRMELTIYGRWSSLSKATHWMPLPHSPVKSDCNREPLPIRKDAQ